MVLNTYSLRKQSSHSSRSFSQTKPDFNPHQPNKEDLKYNMLDQLHQRVQSFDTPKPFVQQSTVTNKVYQGLEPSQPFSVRQKREKEIKDTKALFKVKIERLKEALQLKRKIMKDPQLAQKQFQEAYQDIYEYAQNKLLKQLQKIEECFLQSPDDFSSSDALQKIDDLELRKGKIDKIMQQQKESERNVTMNQVKDIIKKFNVKLMKDDQITSFQKVMLKCHDDYRTFYKYKKGKFFDEEIDNEQSVKQRNEEVIFEPTFCNMVKSKIREERDKQKLQEQNQKQIKMQMNFWENLRLKRLLQDNQPNDQLNQTTNPTSFKTKRASAPEAPNKQLQPTNDSNQNKVPGSPNQSSHIKKAPKLRINNYNQTPQQRRKEQLNHNTPKLQTDFQGKRQFQSKGLSISVPQSPNMLSDKLQLFLDGQTNTILEKDEENNTFAYDQFKTQGQLTPVQIDLTSPGKQQSTSKNNKGSKVKRQSYPHSKDKILNLSSPLSPLFISTNAQILYHQRWQKYNNNDRSVSQKSSPFHSPKHSPLPSISTQQALAQKEKQTRVQGATNRQNLSNVISACYYLENDHEQAYQTKDGQSKGTGIELTKKIKLNQFMEDIRHNTFNKTYQTLKDFETTDEADNIRLLYFYKMQSNEYYNQLSKEVIKEYKGGKHDPSREVGRIEKSRAGVKKLIENMRQKTKKI